MGKKSLVKWLLKGKIIQKRPCEKVSFIFGASILFLLYLGYLILTNNYMHSIEWLYLALIGVGGGYLGVLYYRYRKGKKPLLIFNPWGKY